MNGPLVSLITPCYNGAKHLRPYLKGVLSQTYSNVQFIFVNDGSTDDTENIILSEADKIKEKGWDFVYIRQDNTGQASAVNNALSKVKGKYFSQIDSDDIMKPEYLEKYCNFLESNKDCKFCYAKVAIAKEDFPNNPYRIQYRRLQYGEHDNLFEDYINEHNVPPLSFYMIDTDAFLSVVKLPFYENRGGQNWQILLPMAYYYKCGYIDDVLATCIERHDSHSHKINANRNDRLKKILFYTISKIDMPDGEKQFWYDKITNKYFPMDSQNIKFMLFNIIPILKFRKDKVYLFDCIPIGKIKYY